MASVEAASIQSSNARGTEKGERLRVCLRPYVLSVASWLLAAVEQLPVGGLRGRSLARQPRWPLSLVLQCQTLIFNANCLVGRGQMMMHLDNHLLECGAKGGQRGYCRRSTEQERKQVFACALAHALCRNCIDAPFRLDVNVGRSQWLDQKQNKKHLRFFFKSQLKNNLFLATPDCSTQGFFSYKVVF